MMRKFTQDVGGSPENPRFKAGDIKDLDLPTWRQLASSVKPGTTDPMKTLARFSEPVQVN